MGLESSRIIVSYSKENCDKFDTYGGGMKKVWTFRKEKDRKYYYRIIHKSAMNGHKYFHKLLGKCGVIDATKEDYPDLIKDYYDHKL